MPRGIPKIGVGRASQLKARAAKRSREPMSVVQNGDRQQDHRKARRMARAQLKHLRRLSCEIEEMLVLVEQWQKSIHDQTEQDEQRQVEAPVRFL